MIKDYILYMDGIQNDFNRYISLSQSFDPTKIDITANINKLKLKQFLQIGGSFNKNITVRLFATNEYVYDIIFNFADNDIYIKLECKNLTGHHYTANILIGPENTTTTDLLNVDSQAFINEVILPMKLIFIMYHKHIVDFINKNWTDVMQADTYINNTYDMFIKSLEEHKTESESTN